jgi:hypothetical protein
MLSDAALSIAVDASTKWLYNAARRLKRPLGRSLEDASWWRLTHHLAGRLGIPLVEASRASDLLLTQGSEVSRVRLRSTPDDTVAVSVDLARFYDGAALAAASALHLATPRPRGRPSRTRALSSAPLAARASPSPQEDSGRFVQAIVGVRSEEGVENPGPVVHLLSVLSEAGVPFVIGGAVAAVFHGAGPAANSLDLIADLGARPARLLAQVLNRLGARPRGVHFREGFQFDSVLVRSAPSLALRAEGIALNISRAAPGIGEFPQVRESSYLIALEGLSCRVLSSEAVARAAALARHQRPA